MRPILENFKRDYSLTVGHRAYRLANRSTCYDETMSSYIFKVVKEIKSKKKAHFFDPSNSISLIGFLAIFQMACDSNNSHGEAAMWVVPYFVKNVSAITLKSACLPSLTSDQFLPQLTPLNY